MRLFHLARNPTRIVRSVLLALLLALGSNVFAHAAHSHTDIPTGASTAQHAACGYCATFGGIATPPVAAPDFVASADRTLRFIASHDFAANHVITSGQPRAPPHR